MYSPQSMELYNDYMKIAYQACRVDFNGDDGFGMVEEVSKHIVNLQMKRCTCKACDFSGILCPHAIKILLYLKENTLKEMHCWYSKEAFLLTYKHKLQPVHGEKFLKINLSQRMEPP